MARKALNYQERVAENFSHRADEIARAIAGSLGRASQSQSVPVEKEVEMWNTRQDFDPNSGAPINPGELLAKGMPIEEIVDIVFPLRRKMTEYQRPNPAERVRYADRMNKLSERYLRKESLIEDEDD